MENINSWKVVILVVIIGALVVTIIAAAIEDFRNKRIDD